MLKGFRFSGRVNSSDDIVAVQALFMSKQIFEVDSIFMANETRVIED
jgi:hypothetical protein